MILRTNYVFEENLLIIMLDLEGKQLVFILTLDSIDPVSCYMLITCSEVSYTIF